ncbi:hypothetical protein WJX73_005021 [Symbiochloris irregularis]|uniref:Uncharacterized protein n=1 Tax=Symbiochloris irregularis TaxID=706552 RepID=A0AAW1P7J4_9CHLO
MQSVLPARSAGRVLCPHLRPSLVRQTPRVSRAARCSASADQDQLQASLVKATTLTSAVGTLLAAGNVSAAQELADVAARDGRLGILATLALPALAWVGFNIFGPALNQLSEMQKKAALRSAMGMGVGLTALLAAQQAEAVEAATDATKDGRIGILLTLLIPVGGWVLFNILGPALAQVDNMNKKNTGAAGGRRRGIAGAVGLTAAALLGAQQADAVEAAADATKDGRIGILLTLLIPVGGWVLFNILGPALAQVDNMNKKNTGAAGGRRRGIAGAIGLSAAGLLGAQQADALEAATEVTKDGRVGILLVLLIPVGGGAARALQVYAISAAATSASDVLCPPSGSAQARTLLPQGSPAPFQSTTGCYPSDVRDLNGVAAHHKQVVSMSPRLLLLSLAVLLWPAAGALVHRLEDANVTVLTIAGQDPELDGWQQHPENIILRFFLASQDLGNGSVLVRGSLQRDSLDRRPEFGKLGNPVHVFLCINHKWNPEISLTPVGGGESYPLLFQEQIPDVGNWTTLCPPPDGIDVNHNLSPFYVQAMLPSALINQTLELRVNGWQHYGLYTLKPQVRSFGPRQFWTVLSLPILADDAHMQGFLDSVAVHTQYHLRIGFTGIFMFVRAEHVAALLQYPATARLVTSDKLRLVMWEGLFACEGYPRCYGGNRIGENDKAYQPLSYAIAALFLWKDNAFMYYTDPDEFLLINRPGMSIAELITHPDIDESSSGYGPSD